MKAVFISYGQSLDRTIMELFDKLEIRGFSRWAETIGRGSISGEPHYGTHAWPTKNSTILSVMEDEKATILLEKLRALNAQAEELGMSAFVWNVENKL
ncbi:MAG: hypothetical protein LBI15_01235 [Dysgonamonadaceae bacterium]|jgi:hypothetical protein|nr:hypothetical protein [Dysgonamonadaceae bacterium]